MTTEAEDTPFDAILLVSFGGPEGPDDVLPFLENVTAGRGVPAARLAEVAQQYQQFGGVSPINQQNRDLLRALRDELGAAGIELPIYWGNRNWHPLLEDTFNEIIAAGHRRVLALVTSAFGSRSGCRQYRDDLDRARVSTGDILAVTKVRLYWNHPGFLDAVAARLDDAIKGAQIDASRGWRLVFTAHSIPTAWTDTSPYVAQLRTACAHLANRCAPTLPWDLVFQSRSGPPQVPWLEPDICDHIEALATDGVEGVIVAPIGFVSDHMEVVYDLDTQAAEVAAAQGIRFVRAKTAGTHPAFVAGLRQLLEEHLRGAAPLTAVGEPSPDPCPETCCR